LAHETKVQNTPSKSARAGNGLYWSLMGQSSHSNPSRVLAQGHLILAPELFWVRTCSLNIYGVRCPHSPLHRRTPGARRIANGSSGPRRVVWRWRFSAGGQSTSGAALLCHDRLALTAKVPPWTSTPSAQLGGAMQAGAVVLGAAGQRPCLGHAMGCAGHSPTSAHAGLVPPARRNHLVTRGAAQQRTSPL
jgi:hypothetical protein